MTAKGFRLQPAAEQTLIQIYDYTLYQHSAAQAKEYLTGLRHHFEKIAGMPRLYGRPINPGSPVLKALYGSNKRPHTDFISHRASPGFFSCPPALPLRSNPRNEPRNYVGRDTKREVKEFLWAAASI